MVLLRAASTAAEVPASVAPALLAFHGQHRLLYGHASLTELGLSEAPRAGRGVALLRNLLGVELRVSAHVRLQAQLGAHYAFGTLERAGPPDADHGDVHLLFLEWSQPNVTWLRADVQLRLGRQEMPLGSTRWFSTRDGTNVRQAFDQLRLSLSSRQFEAHAFAGLLPRLRRGWLDDTPDPRSRLLGGYATWHVLPDKRLSFDLFVVARHRPDIRYQEHAGRERRNTASLRAFGETRFGLEYVVHALAQWGALDEARILAWGAAAAIWQRLSPAPYELRLGLRGDALSGDRRRHDRVIGTFHPLFPNQAFFSTQPAIYPANVYDVHPLLKLRMAAVELELGCAMYWRQRVSDAVYGAGGQPLFWGEQSRRALTGVQPSAELLYRPTSQVTLMLAYAQLLAGPGLRAAGGSSVRFFAASMAYAY